MPESFIAFKNNVSDERFEVSKELLRGNVTWKVEELARQLSRLESAVLCEMRVEVLFKAAHRSREFSEGFHRGFRLARLF